MNCIVCSVTLIYLCLGNVAGFIGEKVESIHSPERNRHFTCVSFTKKHNIHQWYHTYPNGNRQHPTYIGNIPKQTSVKLTHFVIKLETFDNNTELQCESGGSGGFWYWLTGIRFFSEKDSILNRTIRVGTNQILKDSKEPAVLKYNETQEVSFECQEYINKTNVVIGVINTTTNVIETYNKTFPDTIFNKSYNGTVLCCIYYTVDETTDNKWITRHVTKKTVLVYDETVTVPVTDRQVSSEEKDKGNQDANPGKQDTDSGKQDVDSAEQDDDSGKQDADSGKQDADSGKQYADSGKQDADSGKQDADSGNQDPGLSNQTIIIYIVSAVAVVFILLVVSVIYLKRFRKKPKVEVETKVLYVDLEFHRRNEPESLPREGPEEESPYAQVIGELRPQ